MTKKKSKQPKEQPKARFYVQTILWRTPFARKDEAELLIERCKAANVRTRLADRQREYGHPPDLNTSVIRLKVFMQKLKAKEKRNDLDD